MTITYLDTSAAVKLVIDETESQALVDALTETSPRLVASWLLHTELHCAAGRNPSVFEPAALQQVLDVVTLVDVTRGDLLAAGTHSPLRSNDAIHLATALRVGADEVLTYDAELAASALAAGLAVSAPS
ncbi:type II toxin-antitoxin system VapC family toxin [Frondihabitans australicus]|uniref:Ribonuclease VapC n=1 Tax=Frondihabitans australicus TaxID=386892 RepID=A0A495IKN5_9MICO|nr:type II toxin-antitoxin system VapC family toxin [Frondihabitans australicus]RKR75998.1 hypothetical protein C8E83_3162 [Frondihabitans australicus]